MTAEDLKKPLTWTISTKLGRAVIVTAIELVDEDPAVLGAGLPIFHEAEIESMKDMAPAQREFHWRNREAYCEDERRLRSINPRRTVWWPWKGREGAQKA